MKHREADVHCPAYKRTAAAWYASDSPCKSNTADDNLRAYRHSSQVHVKFQDPPGAKSSLNISTAPHCTVEVPRKRVQRLPFAVVLSSVTTTASTSASLHYMGSD